MNGPNPPIKGKHIHCPHFSICSGCTFNEFVDKPPILEEMRDYFLAKGIALKVFIGEVIGWRFRAKLAVRGSSENPFIGLYRKGTHDAVDIPHCKVHHPNINAGMERLKAFIRDQQCQPYNEETCKGELRYVQFVVERSTGRLQASLVVNVERKDDPAAARWRKAVQALWNGNNDRFWHSIWLNYNTRRDNVIFGANWEQVYGEELLWETIAGCEVCFHPASFAQANIVLFEKMLRSVCEGIPQDAVVTEYYAGVGVIGLSVVPFCKSVQCVEVNPGAKLCFKQSKARLAAKQAEKLVWHEGRAGDNIEAMQNSNVVIVDPPRKGLDAPLLEALKRPGTTKTLVYVSCHWTSFQRDAEALLSEGWRLKAAEGYLFFPGTNHMETLAIFETMDKCRKNK